MSTPYPPTFLQRQGGGITTTTVPLRVMVAQLGGWPHAVPEMFFRLAAQADIGRLHLARPWALCSTYRNPIVNRELLLQLPDGSWIASAGVMERSMLFILRRISIQAGDTVAAFREFFVYTHPHYLRPLQGDVVPRVLFARILPGGVEFGLQLPDIACWVEASDHMPLYVQERVIAAYKKLHRNGVLHGTVELHNILITPNERVMLIDFRNSRGLTPHPAVGSATPAEFKMEILKVKYRINYKDFRRKVYSNALKMWQSYHNRTGKEDWPKHQHSDWESPHDFDPPHLYLVPHVDRDGKFILQELPDVEDEGRRNEPHEARGGSAAGHGTYHNGTQVTISIPNSTTASSGIHEPTPIVPSATPTSDKPKRERFLSPDPEPRPPQNTHHSPSAAPALNLSSMEPPAKRMKYNTEGIDCPASCRCCQAATSGPIALPSGGRPSPRERQTDMPPPSSLPSRRVVVQKSKLTTQRPYKPSTTRTAEASGRETAKLPLLSLKTRRDDVALPRPPASNAARPSLSASTPRHNPSSSQTSRASIGPTTDATRENNFSGESERFPDRKVKKRKRVRFVLPPALPSETTAPPSSPLSPPHEVVATTPPPTLGHTGRPQDPSPSTSSASSRASIESLTSLEDFALLFPVSGNGRKRSVMMQEAALERRKRRKVDFDDGLPPIPPRKLYFERDPAEDARLADIWLNHGIPSRTWNPPTRQPCPWGEPGKTQLKKPNPSNIVRHRSQQQPPPPQRQQQPPRLSSREVKANKAEEAEVERILSGERCEESLFQKGMAWALFGFWNPV